MDRLSFVPSIDVAQTALAPQQIAAGDFPCELGAFVAKRHGLALAEAEQLIEGWLASYESPRRH